MWVGWGVGWNDVGLAFGAACSATDAAAGGGQGRGCRLRSGLQAAATLHPAAVLPSVPRCSFYLTPMLLPLLKEMPVGKMGVDLTCRAVQVVTVGEYAEGPLAAPACCEAGTNPAWLPSLAPATRLSHGWQRWPLHQFNVEALLGHPLSDPTCCITTTTTHAGIAYCTYAVLGFFGAARYGLRTEGDVMLNTWLPGRWEGALSVGMLLYLTVSVAPMALTLRSQLEE